MQAILSSSNDIDILPFGKELNEAFKKFLNALEEEKVPNRKLL